MSASTRATQKAERQRQILDAATAIFAAKGFDKSNMEEIRTACGLSKGALYLYFENKEALFGAVARELLAQMQQQCEELAADRTRSAGARLGALPALLDPPDKDLNKAKDAPHNHAIAPQPPGTFLGAFWGLYVDIFVQAWQSPVVRLALVEGLAPYLDALTDLVEQGMRTGEFRAVDARLAARGLVAALDGLVLQQIADPNAPVGAAAAQFVQLYIQGLGTQNLDFQGSSL